MLKIQLICVGKMKEKYFLDAVEEYRKRLGAYCTLELTELDEIPRGKGASEADIDAALRKEGARILERLPHPGTTAAMCVEGKQISSTDMAELLKKCAGSGAPRLTFLIGGSDGLHETVKAASDLRISMSKMTFPHHLARVMLLEQIYRGFTILAGTKYHK